MPSIDNAQSYCGKLCSHCSTTLTHFSLQLDKKRVELEKYREQKKRMEDELKKFNSVHEVQEEEYARMANDLQGFSFSPGHQSEPATPPEYRDPGFTSAYTNRNRFSSASLTSPLGLNQRLSRSGSQVTSPPSELAQSREYENEADKLPSKSVPASRRGSSDRFSQYLPDSGIFGPRVAAKYVFPFLKMSSTSFTSHASSISLLYIFFATSYQLIHSYVISVLSRDTIHLLSISFCGLD